MGAFEDAGWFCVDNLPPRLLPALADLFLLEGSRVERAAVVCDVRGGVWFKDLEPVLDRVADARGVRPRVVFLEASDEALINRFRETRRRHPLSGRRHRERRHRARARRARRGPRARRRGHRHHRAVDLGPAPARGRDADGPRRAARGCTVQFVSFGYKHGVPRDADLLLDVRFLPQPPLRRGAAAPDRARPAGGRVRDGGARDGRVPGAPRGRCSTSCCPPTPRRARPAWWWASAAPAAATAAWRSPRCSPSATTDELRRRRVAPPRRPRPARRCPTTAAPVSRRPRIAALGGGTGLASLLRGLKRAPVDITAIVTVADDGGSSGRLRRELGVLPPGDIRNCLVALADDESLLGPLFQHRFADGDLAGHPFGNLFLAALVEVTGSFDLAIQECSRVLKIRGRVLPSTLAQIRLWAERADGEAGLRGDQHHRRPRGLPPGVAGARAAGPPPGARGDRRGRPRAPRPREPLHQRAAPPRGARAGRGGRGGAGAAGLRLQRDDAAGRDRRLRRRRPPGARPGGRPGRRRPGRGARRARSTPRSPRPTRRRDRSRSRSTPSGFSALGVRVVTGDIAEAQPVVRHSPEALAQILVRMVEDAARR